MNRVEAIQRVVKEAGLRASSKIIQEWAEEELMNYWEKRYANEPWWKRFWEMEDSATQQQQKEWLDRNVNISRQQVNQVRKVMQHVYGKVYDMRTFRDVPGRDMPITASL